MGLLDKIRPAPLTSLNVDAGDLLLNIQVPEDVLDQARASALQRFEQFQSYLTRNAWLKEATGPIEVGEDAPPMVSSIAEVTRTVDVAPMMVVPGALVEAVGRDLEVACREAVITCEGVSFIVGGRKRLFLVDSVPESGDSGLAIRVSTGEPYAYFSSSGRMRTVALMGAGRLSVAVVASGGALAEGVGTAICTAMRNPERLAQILGVAQKVEGVRGGMVLAHGRIGVWGGIEIVTPTVR